MSKKHLLLFLAPIFILCITRAFYMMVPGLYNVNIRDTAENNLENPHKLVDEDEDGFSKWFEENISNTSDSVPNDRYVIMVSWAGREYKEIDQVYTFLTQKAKIPESNVIDLGYSNCTYDNFKDALNKIIKTSDQNDIVYIMFDGHGNVGIFAFRDETRMSYEELDQFIDQIHAKAVILTVGACRSGSSIPYLRDGPCPRILITSCSDTEGTKGIAYPFFDAFEENSADKDGNRYVSVNEAGEYAKEIRTVIDPNDFTNPYLNNHPQMSDTSHESLYLVEIEVED